MKVLVTGAAGFYGHNVVKRLVERGDTVRAMVLEQEEAEYRLAEVIDKIEVIEASITDPEVLSSMMQGIDTVIHLAAIPIEKGEATYESVNYEGTINVVNAAVAAGVERFIYASQNAANSKSPSPFIQSKGQGSDVVEQSSLKWTILHPSLTFGKYDRVFNSLARMIRLTPVFFPNIAGGKTEFQPVYIDDVVAVIIMCLDDDATIHQHYNLGGPEVLTLKTLLKRTLKAMGTRRILVPAPIAFLQAPTFIIHRLLPYPPASIPLLNLLAVPNVVLHNNDFEYFGIKPRPFAGEYIQYLKDVTATEAIQNFMGQDWE